jgi:hypothetical protein
MRGRFIDAYSLLLRLMNAADPAQECGDIVMQ